MNKIGLVLSLDRLDAPLSNHFGMAKWLLIYGDDKDFKFVRNTELYGRGVVDEFVRSGCTDAIFATIGQGALQGLIGAQIRPRYGPPDVPVREVIERFQRGELKEATEASEEREPRHQHSHQ
jgi:predicted Fe-Mo cluster-binding NifX family protein